MRHLFSRIIGSVALSFTFLSYANAECPALFHAVMEEEVGIVKFNLEYYKLDPNRSLEDCDTSLFPEGSTLYHIAHHLGNGPIIFYLFVNGANGNATDINGHTPSDISILRYAYKKRCGKPTYGKDRGNSLNECLRRDQTVLSF